MLKSIIISACNKEKALHPTWEQDNAFYHSYAGSAFVSDNNCPISVQNCARYCVGGARTVYCAVK